MPGVFVIVRDTRGSLIHVRRRDDGECVGCIEAGLFEVLRSLVLEEETTARPTEGFLSGGGSRPPRRSYACRSRGNDDGG
jgi:hypothetical protein